MRRPLLLLIAGVLALFRVFTLGFVAVYLGITDFGGPKTALLRVFQVQGLGLVLLLIMAWLREELRREARLPLLTVAAAAPISSALLLRAFFRAETAQLSNPVLTIVWILALVVLDLSVFALAGGALIARRRTHPHNEVRDDRNA